MRRALLGNVKHFPRERIDEGVGLIKSLIDRGVRQVNAPLFVAEQIKKCSAEQGD
jgi:hypothetical protein